MKLVTFVVSLILTQVGCSSPTAAIVADRATQAEPPATPLQGAVDASLPPDGGSGPSDATSSSTGDVEAPPGLRVDEVACTGGAAIQAYPGEPMARLQLVAIALHEATTHDVVGGQSFDWYVTSGFVKDGYVAVACPGSADKARFVLPP